MTRQQRADIVLKELKRLYPHSETILKFSNDWELLVAVMMSAQTTDKQVNKVTDKLFEKYKRIANYANAPLDELTQDISSVNYYKTKAKHIHATANKLLEDFDGELPHTIKDMMTLPGVGRKTAIVVLGNAHDLIEGIAVDTHVYRLARLFGLSDETNRDHVEQNLQKLFPREEWFLLTNRMIDYGREHCPAHCKHGDCPIYNKLDLSP